MVARSLRSREVPRPRSGMAITTVLLALAAEGALFGTLVMSYLFLRAGGSDVPFTHFSSIDVAIGAVNTLVLLISAAFVWQARRLITRGNQPGLRRYLLLALALGTLFVAGQVFEFRHAGIQITAGVFGAAVFALVAFHALHVLAGMTFLVLNWARARLGDFKASRHIAVDIGAWFWYFVTAVWLVLFAVLYLI